MFKKKIQAAKEHVIRNKAAYISGMAGFLVGVTTTVFLVKSGKTNIKIHKAENVLFNWYNVNLGPGHPGHRVRHIETGDVFRSQRDAAKALGLSETNISRCLNGYKDHVNGNHFSWVHVFSQDLHSL